MDIPETWDTPATLVNYAQVTYGPMGVRVTWGESSDMTQDEVRWRCAMLIPTAVFPSVVQLMNNILAQIEQSQLAPDTKSN